MVLRVRRGLEAKRRTNVEEDWRSTLTAIHAAVSDDPLDKLLGNRSAGYERKSEWQIAWRG